MPNSLVAMVKRRLPTRRAWYPGKVNEDNSRFSLGLQDDRKLDRAKLAAGVVSVIALIAMFITTLYRAPDPVWTVVVGVTAVGLTVMIALGVARGRRSGRYR